jgi:hypothetical protein
MLMTLFADENRSAFTAATAIRLPVAPNGDWASVLNGSFYVQKTPNFTAEAQRPWRKPVRALPCLCVLCVSAVNDFGSGYAGLGNTR